MPANTPRGFPYPLPAEPVAEGAQAIRNLAEAIDAKDAGRELAYIEKTADTGLSATSAAAANTIVTAPSITLDGATRIFVEFFCPAWAFPATSLNSFLVLYDGATLLAQLAGITNSSGGAMQAVVRTGLFLTPAVGAHVYSARGWVNTSSVTCRGGTGLAGAIVPVYLRASRA